MFLGFINTSSKRLIQKENMSIQIKRARVVSKKIDMKINKKFKSNELIK